MADRQTDKTRHWKSAIYDDGEGISNTSGQWNALLNNVPPTWTVYTQKEICPDTGREHYQTHVDCGQQQRLSALTNWIKYTKWIPVIGKDHIQNSINYCSKKDTAVEGTYKVIVPTEKYYRIHELLEIVARSTFIHVENSHILDDFYKMSKFIVSEDITFISKISNPILKTLWKEYNSILLQKVAMEYYDNDGLFIIEEPDRDFRQAENPQCLILDD